MEGYDCDCSGCTCANDEDATADDCPLSCFGYSCDYWLSANPAYTCTLMETEYSCDCTACDCAAPSGAPTLSSSPTTSLNPTPTPQTCLSTCYGRSCDGWDTTCSSLEGDYDCDCTGCACGCYEDECCNTNEGAEGSHGKGCVSGYDTDPSACGAYDDENFSSNDMCCACGGGTSTQEPTLSPTLSDPPTVTSQPTLVPAYYLLVNATGSCQGGERGSALELISDVYAPIARTADGRWHYEGQREGFHLYFDSDCDGDGDAVGTSDLPDVWAFDINTPSTEAPYDLDEDGSCSFGAYTGATGNEPPLGVHEWKVVCNGYWELFSLSITMLVPTSIPTATPVPSVTFNPTPEPTPPPSPAPSVTAQPTLVAASFFQVNGSCAFTGGINDVYAPAARTKDGRYYYQGQSKGMFLYFDSDLDGAAVGGATNVWVFDDNEPSTTASSDLDGDGSSRVRGFVEYDAAEPPVGTTAWSIACSLNSFAELDITITLLSPSLAPSVTPAPSTSHRPTATPTVDYFVAQTCPELGVILGGLDFDGAVVNVLQNITCPAALEVRTVAVRIMSTVDAVIKVDASETSESRVLNIGGGARVELETLTLTGGFSSNFGGAIYVDGGSTLNMTSVAVRDNTAAVSHNIEMSRRIATR